MPKHTRRVRAVKQDKRALTTTSYAILGLLAVRPWAAYELAQQMPRSLRHHWARAESRVYMEPANLVAHGLARAATESTGRRSRTVYTITAKGRRALEDWLRKRSAPPHFESEALLRSMFADSGTKEDLLRTLRESRNQAGEMRDQIMHQALDYLQTGGPFPQRLHLIALNGRFLLAYADLLDTWASWAEHEVQGWKDTAPLRDSAAASAVFRRIMGKEALKEIEAWTAAAHLRENTSGSS